MGRGERKQEGIDYGKEEGGATRKAEKARYTYMPCRWKEENARMERQKDKRKGNDIYTHTRKYSILIYRVSPRIPRCVYNIKYQEDDLNLQEASTIHVHE